MIRVKDIIEEFPDVAALRNKKSGNILLPTINFEPMIGGLNAKGFEFYRYSEPTKMVKIDVSGVSQMIRKGPYRIDEVLPYIKGRKDERRDFHGDMIRLGSPRLKVFKKKGTVCVCCGIRGKRFYKERSRGSNLELYHLNLYAVNEYGQEVLMTKDHIKPKSKGGTNELSNLQPMCQKCNSEKGNTWEG